jgi:hypothetical protein
MALGDLQFEVKFPDTKADAVFFAVRSDCRRNNRGSASLRERLWAFRSEVRWPVHKSVRVRLRSLRRYRGRPVGLKTAASSCRRFCSALRAESEASLHPSLTTVSPVALSRRLVPHRV